MPLGSRRTCGAIRLPFGAPRESSSMRPPAPVLSCCARAGPWFGPRIGPPCMPKWECGSIADRCGTSGTPRKIFTNRAMRASKIRRKVDDRYGPGHTAARYILLSRAASARWGNFRLYGGRGTMPTHSPRHARVGRTTARRTRAGPRCGDGQF
jgi:hypothetical protein